MGALDGVKVLDFSSTFLGPYCTMLMAQMGADVIKVEPLAGDVVRNVGPAVSERMSATFLVANSGKRSVAMDLRTSEGQEALARLVSNADVVLHNMRKAAADRLGLTYERLKLINSEIIVGEAYGYASGGPDEGRPAYDDVIQAASGLAYLESIRHGEPQYVTTILADKTCGLMLLYGVLAALYERERTGCGQGVEVPMYESMASYVLIEHLCGEAFIPPRGPALYGRTTSKFRKPYKTSDGYLSVVMYTDAHWRGFFESIGRSDMMKDGKFSDIGARTRNIDALYALVELELARQPTSFWLERFRELDCPASDVRTIEDLIFDPHLREHGVIREEDHPTEGRVRSVGMPLRFSRSEPVARDYKPAPRLGQHTREVLTSVGYSDDEIDRLGGSGVVNASA